jgi:hypothetical protein
MRKELEPLFPIVRKQYDEVKQQLGILKSQREEIETADQDELRRVREEISIVAEGLQMRKEEMEIQERVAAELNSELAELQKNIEECRVKISRAERVKELNRGFEKNEVEGLKSMPSYGLH